MYEVVVTAVAVLCIFGFIGMMIKGGYLNKVLVKFGFRRESEKTNWAAVSWGVCINKLGCKADVAFFGDSITSMGNFQTAFPDKKTINLGMSGDTLAGMRKRVSMLESVSPNKIFVLGGINGLTDFNLKVATEEYDSLLNTLFERMPNAKIYVQSVLPIAFATQRKISCSNKTIEEFNSEIKKLAEKHNFTFVDIHSLYLVNGNLDPTLTKDGIHLLPEGYDRWYEAIREYMA